MFCLRLLVRAREEKRRELIQSLSSFVVQGPERPHRRLVLEDLSDDALLCWMGDWTTRERLDAFLASPTYHALRGAAAVLGQIDSEQVVRGEEIPKTSGAREREDT